MGHSSSSRCFHRVIKSGCVMLLAASVLLFVLNESLVDRQAKEHYKYRDFDTNVSTTGIQPFKVLTKRVVAAPQQNRSAKDKYPPLPSSVLKRVYGFYFDVFLFSAVVGNSSRHASWDRIVLQGWEHKTLDKYNFRCCILYASGVLKSVKLIQKVHWSYKEKTTMPVKQYVCPNVRPIADRPVAVTLSGNSSSQACHKKYNWYLTPQFAHRHEEQIAICSKLAFGSLAADDILAWFELQRMMGVDKVITYTNKLNSEATKVLEYYQKIGVAEVIPFSLPKPVNGRKQVQLGVKNLQAWNDEQVAVYDCLERLKGYKYLVLMDLDEYLVPTEGRAWKELFDSLFKTKAAAGYVFLVQIHVTSWGATNNNSHFKIGRYQNRTKTMADRMKQVVMPDRLEQGGLSTHKFKARPNSPYKRLYAQAKTDGVIHHFRSCRKDWGRKNTTKCEDYKRFTDTTLSDIMSEIENDIINLKNSVLKQP